MRPIDADALKQQFVNKLVAAGASSEFAEEFAKTAFKATFKVIDAQPTIEAEPVRHGRWEMKPDPYGFFDRIPVCSECGCTTKYREKTICCPTCGAKMDLGEVKE